MILTFVILISIFTSALAQDMHGYNLYCQLFGNSTGFGIGFDSRFKKGRIFGYSAGLGYTHVSWTKRKNETDYFAHNHVNSKGLSIPLEINAIFGKYASKFEIGLGPTIYLMHHDETHCKIYYKHVYENGPQYILPDKFTDCQNSSHYSKGLQPDIIATINLGYRLQRKSGFFMKLGMSVLIGNLKGSFTGNILPLPNLCFGYTIPHF